jgi:hypothetical protein
MKYTKISALGKILAQYELPNVLLETEMLTDGDTFIEGSPPSWDSYYDSDWVPFPVKPSVNHTFNYTTKQWEDPRTLQDFKAAKWTQIKQARSNAEYAGFTWDGSTFDSDAISQNRITGAVTLALLSPSFSIDWILADNTTRLLDQSGMAQVGGALGAHVAAQFAKGVMLRAQIEEATSQAEVEAVTW